MSYVRQVYEIVHTVLWVCLAVWVVLLLASLTRIWQAQNDAEVRRALALAAEGSVYCRKWGVTDGSHAPTICMLDLREIRARDVRRLANAAPF